MISERSFSQAFHSFWSELLPLLTPQFVSLFNEAFQTELFDAENIELSPLAVGEGVKRPDIVAEFAFRLAQTRHSSKLACNSDVSLVASAQTLALNLIQRYEGSKPTSMIPLTEEELEEGFRLESRYPALASAFSENAVVEFCPQFMGAGFLSSSEGDIGIDDTLIEVKTTLRRVAGKDIRQLITYLALDANSGSKRWTHIGVFNPRRGTLHRAEIDSLVLRLSGGKPKSDVFADLISFVESNETMIDHRF